MPKRPLARNSTAGPRSWCISPITGETEPRSLQLNRRAMLACLSAILPIISVPSALISAGIVAAGAAPTPMAPWPSGWDDPRFAANTKSPPRYNTGSQIVTWRDLTVIDQSGNPSFGYGNYSLLNTRIRSREGPRVSGNNILIEWCYIEVAGLGDDHADGIQAYGGSTQGEMKNIIIRNTKVICKGGALNAGIFFADHAGADLTLDSVYVDGGASPNGAIWLANARGDAGCKSLIARHVRVKSDGVYGQRGFRLDPTPSFCNIIEWTDVCWDDGTPIARPT